MKVTVKKQYTLSCSCGKSITVDDLSAEVLKSTGWKIVSYQSPADEKSIKSVSCPECLERERLRKYSSNDIRDRISAGYYQDNPEKYYDDALKHVGLAGHPKASKAFSYAYELGHAYGHEEVLSNLEGIAEVIL